MGEGNIAGICSECSRIKKKLYQQKNKHRIYKPGDLIKAPVTENEVTEHIWFTILDPNKDPILCRVNSDPINVPSVNYQDVLRVRRDNIEEWLSPDLTENEVYEQLYATYKELFDYIEQNPHEHE